VTHLTNLADQGRSESQPALYLPMVLVELGYAAEQNGDPEAALALHAEAYAAAEAMGAPRDTISTLEGMASAVAGAEPEVAARLLGAAAAARETAGAPAAPAERDELERVGDRLTAVLGRAGFDALAAAGRELSVAEARALVRSPTSGPGRLTMSPGGSAAS
jgi:hypothetical protein